MVAGEDALLDHVVLLDGVAAVVRGRGPGHAEHAVVQHRGRHARRRVGDPEDGAVLAPQVVRRVARVIADGRQVEVPPRPGGSARHGGRRAVDPVPLVAGDAGRGHLDDGVVGSVEVEGRRGGDAAEVVGDPHRRGDLATADG